MRDLPDVDAREDAALWEIVEGTAAETGERFFDRLVLYLARSLSTRYAWVTEWLEAERRLRALSFWVGDGYRGEFEYAVADTPCEVVVRSRDLVHVPERVIELYPGDPDLGALGAVSYMGVPLLDDDGRLLGHLAVMHDAPMPKSPRADAIFRIFAGRAAAELRRIRRDRDLVEREQRLSRLVDTAMDAILELDAGFAVVRMNRAAERAFDRAAASILGAPVDQLLAPASRETLRRLAADLERQPEGRQAMWIPNSLEGMRAAGRTFAAEATLSRFEVGGQPHLTVILRDVEERVVAEDRIRALASETASLRAEIDALQGFDEIVGESDALRRVLADVHRVAVGDTTVLITGETGTGKELVARAIHRMSTRASRPIVKVNCAAIAPSLQESEFFGHEKGAFTGATQRRQGRIQLADGGTIFLDEVGEMPLDLQAKLLRVLQEGEFEPVGSSRTIRVDVRVVAATNCDLERMVKEGTFRRDLLYRLNVFPVHLPPLRERGNDVVLLAVAIARSLARRRGMPPPILDAGDAARLLAYDWPGNVRELHNVIERALITSADGRRLNLARALPDGAAAPGPTAPAGTEVGDVADGGSPILTAADLQELERRNISRALELTAGKISGTGGAAALLGLNPNTLASRMKSLGIPRPGATR